MRKILTAIGMALTLSGCVTASQASDYFCKHQDEIRIAAAVAMTEAEKIKDPVKRETAVSAVNITLAALGKCPPGTTPDKSPG